jgi:hypothetical protein
MRRDRVVVPLAKSGINETRKSVNQSQSDVEKMVLTAILACLAAILQSLGGFLPGIGYLFSPFSTAPLFIISWLSPKRGLFAYGLTLVLLWVLQPSELVVFPFTTGLLGIAIGFAVRWFTKRLVTLLFSGIILTLGIDFVLVVIRFPLFGPIAQPAFSIQVTVCLFAFSIFYSWLWLEAVLFLIKRLFGRYCTKTN